MQWGHLGCHIRLGQSQSSVAQTGLIAQVSGAFTAACAAAGPCRLRRLQHAAAAANAGCTVSIAQMRVRVGRKRAVSQLKHFWQRPWMRTCVQQHCRDCRNTCLILEQVRLPAGKHPRVSMSTAKEPYVSKILWSGNGSGTSTGAITSTANHALLYSPRRAHNFGRKIQAATLLQMHAVLAAEVKPSSHNPSHPTFLGWAQRKVPQPPPQPSCDPTPQGGFRSR